MGNPSLPRGPATSTAASGIYKPRRAAQSPLFRLLQDRFTEFHACYDERFASTYGDWRPVVREVAEKFLACGILAHGFARVRCEAVGCGHEYLVAFSCKARYFCPSCHAKRLALWTLWLEETLLEPAVPHRQVVLTIPKRLRAWCLYRRRLLGDIARVAARTVTAAVRTLTRDPDLAVGIVACIQTHGSRANWHPHIHMIVTDGGFRPDGTFVPWPAHDTAALTEAFRRAVLRAFVRRGVFEPEEADAMLAWPHSGFHVHDAVWVSDGDTAFALRLARYCARNPVALERLTYEPQTPNAPVRYRSDKTDGPTAGTETVDPLEFLARVTAHIPDKHQVMTRYSGWYANRVRGKRRSTAVVDGAAVVVAPRERVPLREAQRRWAELLRRIYDVDPLTCPACGGPMRIVAFITERVVIERILAHLAARSSAPGGRREARAPPSTSQTRRRRTRSSRVGEPA